MFNLWRDCFCSFRDAKKSVKALVCLLSRSRIGMGDWNTCESEVCRIPPPLLRPKRDVGVGSGSTIVKEEKALLRGVRRAGMFVREILRRLQGAKILHN